MGETALKQLEWLPILDFDDEEYYTDSVQEEESEGEAFSYSGGSEIYSDGYDEYGLIDYDSDFTLPSPSLSIGDDVDRALEWVPN
jgi:hypothetical protein